MKLDEAKRIALSLVERMAPYCDQIEVAGSVRRCKAEVKDLELVVCVKWEERPNPELLFGEPVSVNLLYDQLHNDALIRWIKPGVKEVIDWPLKPDGKYWRAMLPEGIKLDLFLCNVSNYGLLFMIRTGPDTFSKELVTQQYKGGLLPDEYRVTKGQLWKGETVIETPTEQSVFDVLGIPFILPEERGIKAR